MTTQRCAATGTLREHSECSHAHDIYALACGYYRFIVRSCIIMSHVRIHSTGRFPVGSLSTPAWETENKPIRVGDGTWIGANAILLSSATVGDYSIIAEGAIVKKDVPAKVTGQALH